MSEKEQNNPVTSEQRESEMWSSVRHNIKENIAVYTVLITLMTFLMRGLWYFYSLGYFNALKIDTCYLRVDNENSLYNAIGWLGITIIFIALNYIMYSFIKNKQGINATLIFVFELILLFIIICVTDGITGDALLQDIHNWKDVVKSVVLMFLCVVMINIYAFAFGAMLFLEKMKNVVHEKVFKVKKAKSTKEDKEEENEEETDKEEENEGETDKKEKNIITDILLTIFSIALATAAIGVVSYLTGRSVANDKLDYKIIERKTAMDDVDVEEKYIFPGEDDSIAIQYYAVLYETSDNYIVAALYRNGHKVEKDIYLQNVFSKEDVRTQYCGNLEKVKID